MIRSNIRFLALEWLRGGIVRFTFQRIVKQQCFQAEFEIPNLNQMTFRRCLLPGCSPIIREPPRLPRGSSRDSTKRQPHRIHCSKPKL